MSQVGYMFMAVGAGTVAGAMFHLLTHAFFKAVLFMAAGCVIHLAGDENDIFKMGGLARRGPVELFWIFLAGAVCLAGLPLTGGFFSKDGILLALFTHPDPLYKGFWLIGVVTALLTAFYTFRLVYLVFFGEYRGTGHPHTIPLLMRWPLWPLALFGLIGGMLNLPAFVGGGETLHHWYGALAGRVVAASHAVEWMLAGLAVAIAALGWFVAYRRYRNYQPPMDNVASRFLLNGWYADALVDRIFVHPFAAMARFCSSGCDRVLFDGTLSGLARLASSWGRLFVQMTTGRLTTYLSSFAWGFLFLLGWFLLKLVNGGGH
jgi:NADH-quinone oxidoreductase subunit L